MSDKDKVIKERLGVKRDEHGSYCDKKFVCNRIAYDHDAIIEASAGTGKTYTLQSIVLKLLVEEKIDSVKNLLLVTYTEKAAGELRDRIRKVLEEADCLPSDFDEVTICTIHSFCRSLLTEYAFENRVPMQVEIGGTDGDLIHCAVRMALQGDDFKARYGESYDAYMGAAGLKSTDDLVASVEARLNDYVQRNEEPKPPRFIDDAIRGKLLNSVANASFDFTGMEVNARARQGFEEACRTIDEVKGSFASDDLPTFVQAVAKCAINCEKMNPSVNGHGRGVRLFDLRSDVKAFSEAVADARNVCSVQMPADLAFMAWPVFMRLKDEVASLTFDDLVNRARNVIVAEAKLEKPDKKSALLESIRKKYRIALVDEFQDTDDMQWEIFKSIFSHQVNTLKDGPRPERGSLLVVGDPKQAIYSFRGANIGAYLSAKRDITGGDDEEVKRLNTTFRSSPKLVDAFNDIFGKKVGNDPSWFEDMKEGDGSIDYKRVESPDESDKSNKFKTIDYDPDFGDPVELLESLPKEQKTPQFSKSGYGNKSCCLPVFLRNAAREMKRLLTLNRAYTTVDAETGKKVERRFSYRDMCILVRGHADADKARAILAEANIPFSVYKEQGIYASAEAEALLSLFDFLSAPSRRGRLEALLLTPLFGYRPDLLEARCKQEDREFSGLLDFGQELILKKKWSKFFESVMNDTLLAHPRKDDADFDRSWAATRQILDKLLEQVGRKAQTIDEFADVLRSWRQNDQRAGEDGALRRKETEADCVQIMTMHVSKGLEYPVVFIAWGFGELGYNAEANKKEAAIREEKRLLYVALTRAEHKLYLPWSRWAQHKRKKKAGENEEWDETGIGSVGSALLIPNDQHAPPSQKNPDLGFLARGIRACFGSDDAAKAAVIKVSERAAKADAVAKENTQGTGAGEGIVAEKDITVYELDAKALARQHVENDSYSSIHRKSKQTTEPTYGDTKEDENQVAAQTQNKEKTLLPRNNISGDVFHEIMETLCNNDDSDGKTLGFCTVGKADFGALVQEANSPLLSLIGKVMRRHQIASQKNEQGDDSTELVLARMVWRALNVPIPIGKGIKLRDIEASNRRAEAEFVVNRALTLDDELPSEDDPQRDSAFNGKIDLLIRPDGRDGPVYVLDWKTNSLPDYGPETLKRAMTKADYHLQYQFYSQAVRFWLREAELGGVAYLFVRAGEKSECPDGESGVFVAEAENVTQEACRTAIKEALKQEAWS